MRPLPQTGGVRKRLGAKLEAVMFVLLEHAVTQQRLVIGNTHLFWDPYYPHVKAMQAELACAAVRAFMEVQALQGAAPPAFVLVGDFNSVPRMQPAFLPASQAAALPVPLPREWTRSATYELLSSGQVPRAHPEHPDTFGKASAATAGASDAPADAPPQKKAKKSSPGLGPLRSNLQLRDGYAGALCDGPLPLSTHANDFAGCLDYIWVSLSSPVSAATEPPQTGSDAGATGAAVTSLCAAVEVHEVLEMPYALDSPEQFGKIPSAEWPSDHLALGARISLPPAPGPPLPLHD